MDFFLIFIGVLLIILGLAGCFLPVLPGPPLAFPALLLLQFRAESPFTSKFLIILGLIVLAVTILDYMIPVFGAKRWGGSRFGILGATIGVVVGLFVFPPIGFFIFPILGAIAGEVIGGADYKKATKAGLGTFAGLVLGTMLKFCTTLVIAYYFFTNL